MSTAPDIPIIFHLVAFSAIFLKHHLAAHQQIPATVGEEEGQPEG
jgi:hypothetical protein